MKIVLDVYGGDNSPYAHVEAAALAVNEYKDLKLILTGREAEIREELKKHRTDLSRIEIINASEVITNLDMPTDAIKHKKDSSMVKGIELCAENSDIAGMVTTGSTGAALSGGVIKLGKIKGVRRPALAVALPNLKGGKTLLLDCGANVDCAPEFLEQFAVMGSAYMRAVYGVENPAVTLISNGSEDKKGNDLVKSAFPLLAALPINFAGNIESKDALSGDSDVLICDGFVGNVLLKSIEGTVSSLMKMIKSAIMSGGLGAKIGGKLIKPALKKMQKVLGEDENGGAAFLGCAKLLVKAHGGSFAAAIKTAIGQLYRMEGGGFIDNVTKEIDRLTTPIR